VPSIGGGTKLIRTLLAGEGEGVCSGLGDVDADCSDEIEGDSSSVGEGIGVDGSSASTTHDKIAMRNTRLALVVMSSEVETSLTF
jgi:hypothetical protein